MAIADPNNPYLVRRGTSVSQSLQNLPSQVSSLIDARERASALASVKEMGERAQKVSEMSEQRLQRQQVLDEGERVRSGSLAQQEQSRLGRGTDISERAQTLTEKQDVASSNFGLEKAALFEKHMTDKGLDKAYLPIIQQLKDMGTQEGLSHREVYNSFKSNWPIYKESVQKNLLEEFNKERDPIRSRMLLDQIKSISEDASGQVIDQLMPTTSQQLTREGEMFAAETAVPFSQTEEAARLKAGVEGAEADQKRLDELRDDYRSITRQAASTRAGENQFVPNENKDAVAAQLESQAKVIAQQFVSLGGAMADLGLSEGAFTESQIFESPEDVRQAVLNGQMSPDDATNILISQFGFTE